MLTRWKRATPHIGALLLFTGCGGADAVVDPPPPPEENVGLALITDRLTFPVGLASLPGDSRLFVLEKDGRVRIVENGTLSSTMFLDFRAQVSSGGEQGLLGMAFHPEFDANRLVVLSYTDRQGNSVLSTARVSAGNPNRIDPATEIVGLMVTQPFSNHNGGHVAFGPDGMLFFGLGDGGSGGDPQGNGQNLSTVLGKMLRFEVTDDGLVQPAPGNPFVDQTGIPPSIWARGLRNPWRFSFDRERGDLYIADVGQNLLEEINLAPAGTTLGRGNNYGWRIAEGSRCFSPPTGCAMGGLTAPILEYDHTRGCAVVGGYIYRGQALPNLHGVYFYGDFCLGDVRSFRLAGTAATELRDWPTLQLPGSLTSFGEGGDGELYLLGTGGGGGFLYRLVRQP